MERSNRSVLVVGDDVAEIGEVVAILSDRYRVRVCNSPERALEFCATQNRPDLLIIDLRAQNGGLDLCARVKHNLATVSIAVLVVLAANDAAGRKSALSCGAADWLAAPVSAPRLRGLVQAHIGQPVSRAPFSPLAHCGDVPPGAAQEPEPAREHTGGLPRSPCGGIDQSTRANHRKAQAAGQWTRPNFWPRETPANAVCERERPPRFTTSRFWPADRNAAAATPQTDPHVARHAVSSNDQGQGTCTFRNVRGVLRQLLELSGVFTVEA